MKKNKRYRYPTLTISISENHRKMYEKLKNKYYVNMSKIFRDTIENVYKKYQQEKMF